MNGTLLQAADVMYGKLQGSDGPFTGVSTDTRTLAAGELFFALTGPNFDGNEFVADARRKGAAGAVVARIENVPMPQIEVADTLLALGSLGASWRGEQTATVIGITGSNGKTTLRALAAACIGRVGSTLATAGNLNNEIGVPLMLMRIQPEHRYAVLEMGANHAGEIAYLTSLAKPHVVALTNAGPAHLEGFGSIEGVSRAKGEILQGSPRPACAVLNADDDYFGYWQSLVEDIRVLSFGLSKNADVRASDIVADKAAMRFRLHSPAGTAEVRLPLGGIHNVSNACAAAAIALALDVPLTDIVAGLESAEPVSGRLKPLAACGGAALYDDSYNANPVSLLAAAEFLASLDGEKWLVLGDMFELGDDAEALHRIAGEQLRAAGIDRLFALGKLSRAAADAFGSGGAWFESVDRLVANVREKLTGNVSVLVKGSRGMRMERVVEALRAPDAMVREA